MKKHSNEPSLTVNGYSVFNSKSNQYEITFDFFDKMEYLNGIYDMTLVASDINSDKKLEWNLGQIQV